MGDDGRMGCRTVQSPHITYVSQARALAKSVVKSILSRSNRSTKQGWYDQGPSVQMGMANHIQTNQQ
jgi:hypothetical protein